MQESARRPQAPRPIWEWNDGCWWRELVGHERLLCHRGSCHLRSTRFLNSAKRETRVLAWWHSDIHPMTRITPDDPTSTQMHFNQFPLRLASNKDRSCKNRASSRSMTKVPKTWTFDIWRTTSDTIFLNDAVSHRLFSWTGNVSWSCLSTVLVPSCWRDWTAFESKKYLVIASGHVYNALTRWAIATRLASSKWLPSPNWALDGQKSGSQDITFEGDLLRTKLAIWH